MTLLAKYGPRLLDAGYSILPIKYGAKYPGFDGWEKTVATPKLLEQWYPKYHGVGVLTRDTPLVDIDVLDADLAAHMIAYVQEWYGPAPLRIGRAPKAGLLFRTDTPFKKVQSALYRDEFWTQKGDPEFKLEVLGEGQQFVAYATHPDTKQPYTWPNGDPPPALELPTLSEDDARDIVREFERQVELRGWTKKPGASRASSLPARRGTVDHDDVFAADKGKVEDVSDDALAAKLMLVPHNDDHDHWVFVGMALYHQFDGDDRGLELWHEWSQSAHNYDADALDERWKSFAIEGKRREPITARYIIKHAKEAEKEIKVETFARIKKAIVEAPTDQALQDVCDEVKSIRFETMERQQIVSLVQAAFKRITGTALAVSSARRMTQYENPEITEAPYWLRDMVHVSNGNLFWSRKRRLAYSVAAFDAQHNRYMLSPVERLEGKAVPDTRASDFALNVVRIEAVAQALYMPGEDDVFTYNGVPAVNTYSDRNVPEVPDRLKQSDAAAIKLVKEHISIFGSERDQRILVDVLAYIVQNPGKRVNFGVLLQGTEGDGKTVFARLMAAVLGQDNVKSLPAQALEEKFTSWAEGGQAIFVEEIKLQGHNRFDVLNKVKPLLTNKMISVRRMNTDIYEAPNRATYFLLTNYVDALPVGLDDSRYFILFSRFQTQEALHAFMAANPGYYDRLHEAIDNKAGALRHWLLNHEISADFNPNGRAPKSEGKNQMVAYNQSEEETAILDVIANSPHIDLTKTLLNTSKLAEEVEETGVTLPHGKGLHTLLLKLGFRSLGRLFIGGRKGKPVYFWSQTPARFYGSDGKVDNLLIRKYLDDEL